MSARYDRHTDLLAFEALLGQGLGESLRRGFSGVDSGDRGVVGHVYGSDGVPGYPSGLSNESGNVAARDLLFFAEVEIERKGVGTDGIG